MRFNRTHTMAMASAFLAALCAAAWVGAGTTGIISGSVKSAEDGTPLSGVNIVVQGTTLSTVTDSQGRFVITNVPPGDYSVRAELVGYATKTLGSVQVTMDMTATADFEIQEQATQEETVVVTRPRPMVVADAVNTLNQITAQQESLTRLDPGSVRTAAGLLSALPGVVPETDGSGQMHVRGGRSDQVGWYVEGIPITDPNTGLFGTNLYTTGLSKFQAYPGGFGAEYGNAISGVLNEVKKTGADSPGVNLNIEYGSDSYWSGLAELGGGSADEFNYYLGSALQRCGLDGPLIKELQYSDNSAKLVWPWENNSIAVLALQGTLLGRLEAFHDTGDMGAPTAHEKDFMDQRYAVTAVTWSHNFSPASFLTVRPFYLQTKIKQNIVGTYGTYADIWSARKGIHASYTGQVSPSHLVKFGGSLMTSDNNWYLYPGFPLYRADVNTFQTDVYVEDQVSFAEHWTANFGLRRDAIRYDRTGREYVVSQGYSGAELPDVSESRITPRFGISFAPDERTAWKASWGRYAKFVPASSVQHIYFDPDMTFGPGMPTLEQMMPGLGSTAPQTSTAMELSFEKQVSDSVAFRVTPFYTKYENLGDQYADPTTGVTTYATLGEGNSKGLEIYVHKRMTGRWQGWLSYTYQKTRTNRADLGLVSDMYYAPWDQTHTLALVTDVKTGPLSHTLRADLGSGRADRGDPTLQERADPYCVLSYILSYKLPLGSRLGESLYLSVFNLSNSRQTMQYRWDPGPVRVADSWVPARFVSLGVSSTF